MKVKSRITPKAKTRIAAKVKLAPKAKSRVEPLVKGQLWKMNDIHVEIMEVGKTLTHYRLYQNQKRVPISLGGIGTVQEYLKKNKAILVKRA
jgi:hypothetical protein